MRTELQKTWNCKVYDVYGLSEMGTAIATECEVQNGLHINEVSVFTEVVNPETGKVLGKGSVGELVFTSLGRKGRPLIRYKSRDLSKLIDEPCSCGALVVRRIGRVKRITA